MAVAGPRLAVAQLAELLDQIACTLTEQLALLADQRRAVAVGDLAALLALVERQEASNARLARLEARRQAVQQGLERALGASGLREVVETAARDELERAWLLELLATVERRVLELRRENALAAALLADAVEVAARSRAFLSRLVGAEAAYGPADGPSNSRPLPAAPAEAGG